MDLDDTEYILQHGPLGVLSGLFTTLDHHHSVCSGAGCPCNKVVGCLQQVRSDLQKLLQEQQFFGVFNRMLANFVDSLVENGHKGEAAVACAELEYSLIACAVHSQRISRSTSTVNHASTAAAAAAEAAAAELKFATSFHQRLLESVLFEQQLKAQQDKQWDKIILKLDKVSKALPAGSSTFTAANASKLSDWLTRNFDSALGTALPSTHTFMIWTAALCRIWPKSVFDLSGQRLLIVAAGAAAKVLQVCAAMCRLQAAGITFTAQLPAAAAAAAVELSALLLIDLAAESHIRNQQMVGSAEQARVQGVDFAPVQHLVLPLGIGELRANRPQLLLLCNTVLAIHGSHLQQQQQQQQLVAAGGAVGGSTGAVPAASSANGVLPDSSSSSSSSSRTSSQLAEALLLQRADNLTSAMQQQQQQQRLLARLLLKAHAQHSADIGYSAAAVDEIMTHLRQGLVSSCVSSSGSSSDSSSGSSSSSSGGSSSSDRGIRACSTLALPTCARAVYAAALLLQAVVGPEAQLLCNPRLCNGRDLVRTLTPGVLGRQLMQAPGFILAAFSTQLQFEGKAAVQSIYEHHVYLADVLDHWQTAGQVYNVYMLEHCQTAGPQQHQQQQQQPQQRQEVEATMLQTWLFVLGQSTHMLRQLVQLLRPSTCLAAEQEKLLLLCIEQLGKQLTQLSQWCTGGVVSATPEFVRQVHAQTTVSVMAGEAALRLLVSSSSSSSSRGSQGVPELKVKPATPLSAALVLFQAAMLMAVPQDLPQQPCMLQTVEGQQLMQALCSLGLTACKIPGASVTFIDVWRWFVCHLCTLLWAQPTQGRGDGGSVPPAKAWVCTVTGHVLCGCAELLQQVGADAGWGAATALLLGSQSQMGLDNCTAHSAARELLQSVAELLLLPAAAAAAVSASSRSSSSSRGLTGSGEFRSCFAELMCDYDKRGRQLQTANAQEGGGAAVTAETKAVQLVQIMHQAGRLLCAALPSAFCCNNPGCRNLGTVSEAFALVRGKACVCGGCKAGCPEKAGGAAAARYCCAACQAVHWPEHRKVCGQL